MSYINTKIKEFVNANILEAEVGTTGYCGGDSGHGGNTYFRLKDLASTDIQINVASTGNEVEIIFGGDSELTTFIQALEFAVNVLKEQSKQQHQFPN